MNIRHPAGQSRVIPQDAIVFSSLSYKRNSHFRRSDS